MCAALMARRSCPESACRDSGGVWGAVGLLRAVLHTLFWGWGCCQGCPCCGAGEAALGALCVGRGSAGSDGRGPRRLQRSCSSAAFAACPCTERDLPVPSAARTALPGSCPRCSGSCHLPGLCPSLLLLCTLQLCGEGRAGPSAGRRCLLDGTRKKIFNNTFRRQVFLFALALQTGVVVLKINANGDMAADLQLPHDSCLRNTERSRSLDAQFKVRVFRRTDFFFGLSGQKSK